MVNPSAAVRLCHWLRIPVKIMIFLPKSRLYGTYVFFLVCKTESTSLEVFKNQVDEGHRDMV